MKLDEVMSFEPGLNNVELKVAKVAKVARNKCFYMKWCGNICTLLLNVTIIVILNFFELFNIQTIVV
jgi:hypothetical protein